LLTVIACATVGGAFFGATAASSLPAAGGALPRTHGEKPLPLKSIRDSSDSLRRSRWRLLEDLRE